MTLAPSVLIVGLALAAAPSTPEDAEKQSRVRWFEFELTEVKSAYKGDWVAFYAAKDAKEQALNASEAKQSTKDMVHLTLDQARARRVAALEFEAVAKHREGEIRLLARTVLEAMKRGDFEPLAADCAMYSATAPNRAELTRQYFEKNKAQLQAGARIATTDAGDFAAELQFEGPSPETGMTGQVLIPFGPEAPPPKDSERYPDRYRLELWWSGEVMPEANGPLNPSPKVPRLKSRWRLHQLIAPYSRRRSYLR